VLGGYVVGELNSLGQRSKQYVYAGGERLLEHSTTGGFNSINWQHRNPLTDTWINVDPNGFFSFRTEVDAHGRETGIEAPIILPNEPLPPPTRSPSYLEMHGGATIEAEAGMQLYEDVFLNKFFETGNGPAEGGYDRLRALREFQLSLGVKFALGMSWLDLNNRENYEPVLDYVTQGREGFENGRRVNHHRLKPGTQQKGKTGPSGKEKPQDPYSEVYDKVEEVLKDSKCSQFAQDILSVLPANNPVYPAGGTLLDVFHEFLNQKTGRPLFTKELPPGSLGYGNPIGNIRKGTAQIAMPASPHADGIIAELFHLAGRNKHYTDKQLAEAVRRFPEYAEVANKAIDPSLNIYDSRYQAPPNWTEENEGGYSAYFHYAQYNICFTGPSSNGMKRLIR
jgi:hypothetical protein